MRKRAMLAYAFMLVGTALVLSATLVPGGTSDPSITGAIAGAAGGGLPSLSESLMVSGWLIFLAGGLIFLAGGRESGSPSGYEPEKVKERLAPHDPLSLPEGDHGR